MDKEARVALYILLSKIIESLERCAAEKAEKIDCGSLDVLLEELEIALRQSIV